MHHPSFCGFCKCAPPTSTASHAGVQPAPGAGAAAPSERHRQPGSGARLRGGLFCITALLFVVPLVPTPFSAPEGQGSPHRQALWSWSLFPARSASRLCHIAPCSYLPHVQPEFLQPRQPLSVLDAMAALRRHFDGTDHDGYGNRCVFHFSWCCRRDCLLDRRQMDRLFTPPETSTPLTPASETLRSRGARWRCCAPARATSCGCARPAPCPTRSPPRSTSQWPCLPSPLSFPFTRWAAGGMRQQSQPWLHGCRLHL